MSGALSRLEKQYELITKEAPLFAKNERKARYFIADRYLAFWFAFVQSKASLISQNNYDALKMNFLERYETFSGRALEQLFFELFRTSKRFETLGRWWDRRGQNEIDLIAMDSSSAYFFEIKRNCLKYSAHLLANKVSAFLDHNPTVQNKQIFIKGLSLKDLQKDTEEILNGSEKLF